MSLSAEDPTGELFPSAADTGAGFQVLSPRLLPVGWERWERYQILDLLGEGGMGRVFKAVDPVLKRTVALKFLRFDDPGLARRLSLEAQIQAGLDHENIVKVYETGEFQGFPYIAMQYIEGRTLDALRGLDLAARVELLAEVARALDAAHQQGLVHRDLKPSNILVELQKDRRKPYLMDFGLARHRSVTAATTKLMGTLAYMAPEQAEGGRPLDERTDVHALGAMLYEFLAGHPPFAAGDRNDVETLRRLLYEEPRPPAGPADLVTIALKSLEKDPGRRYPTARAFAEELDRWREGRPILARRAGAFERLRKGFHRLRRNRAAYRTLLGSAALLALLLAGLGAVQVRARLQTDLTARIGPELVRLEAVARDSRLLPLHDLRADRARIQELLADIRRLAGPYGGLGRGPVRYAEGRARMALEQFEEARTDLEAAWSDGFRIPEVSEALGRTLLEVHRLRSGEVNREADPQRRTRLAERLDRELRDPALRQLERARGGDSRERATLEALRAAAAGRPQEALAGLDRALRAAPLDLDLLKLQASTELTLYRPLTFLRIDWRQAGAHLGRAEQALARALEIGRSDPQVRLLWIEVDQEWMLLSHYLPEVDAGRAFHHGLELCNQVRGLDPSDPRPLRGEAQLYRAQANVRYRQGADPRPAYRQAVGVLREAIALAPERIDLQADLGRILWELASTSVQYGAPADEDLAEARRILAAALAREPGNPRILHSLLEVSFDQALAGDRRGDDVRPQLRSTRTLAEQLLALDADEKGAQGLLLITQIQLGLCNAARGMDPLADFDRAIAGGRAALARQPKNEELMSNLALAFTLRARRRWQSGEDWRPDLHEGLRLVRASVAIRATNPAALQCLALAEGSEGLFRLDGAEDPRPYLERGLAAYARAQAQDPKDPLTLGAALDLRLAGIRWLLARHRLAAPELAALRRELDRLRRLDPRGAAADWYEAQYLEARIREQGGRSWAPAFTALERAARRNPWYDGLPGLRARLLRESVEGLAEAEAAPARARAEALLRDYPLLRREYGPESVPTR